MTLADIVRDHLTAIIPEPYKHRHINLEVTETDKSLIKAGHKSEEKFVRVRWEISGKNGKSNRTIEASNLLIAKDNDSMFYNYMAEDIIREMKSNPEMPQY